MVVNHADVVKRDRVVVELPCPAEIRQSFGIVTGGFVDLGQQDEGIGPVRVEKRGLPECPVGSRGVTFGQ